MEKRIITATFLNETLNLIIHEILENKPNFENFDLKLISEKEWEDHKSNILLTDDKFFHDISKDRLHYSKIFLINTSDETLHLAYSDKEVVIFTTPVLMRDLFERISNTIEQSVSENLRKLNFKDFVYDPNMRILSNKDSSMRFTEKESQIFSCLLKNGNKHLSKKILLKKVWSYNEGRDTHTLETHIYSLRRKIEKNLRLKGLIVFEEDKGYYLNKNIL